MASPAKPSRSLTLKVKTSASTAPLGASAATLSAMSPPPNTPGSGTKIILKRSLPPTPAALPDSASGFPSFSGTAATPTPTTSALATPPAPISMPSAALAAATAAITAIAVPVAPSITMTQKGRVSRPTAKKRAREFDESDDELLQSTPLSSATATQNNPPKRPKLIVRKSLKVKPASIVLKQVPKEAPPHSRGEGYDSEEEDRENDPAIEEEFVLRMPPGDHCDYLRKMTEERKIGVPVKEGGADFQLRWLPGVERRALVTVNGTRFVGVLVDLPTITEGMKTWDKRNFMKSADICQMLLVYATVADDAEAKSLPLPAMVAKDYRWPHGLTPPMHDCVHRRFRKRLSKKEIKDKEAELQRLLNEDRIAVDTKWELIDDGRAATAATTAGGAGVGEYDDVEMEEGEEDAEGEEDMDYYGQQQQQQQPGAHDDIDDAELEAMFLEEDGDDDAAAGASAETAGAEAAPEKAGEGAAAAAGAGAAVAAGATSGAAAGATSGAGGVAEDAGGDKSEAEDDEAEEDDDDDDDDDDDEDMDADQLAQAEQVKGVREDISELKKQLQQLENNLAGTQNTLLRKRLEGHKKRVISELRLKQASIGEVDEEE